MRPEISVSKMVQLFKGSSSRVIREEFPELKEFLWVKAFGQMDILLKHRVKLAKTKSENTLKINRASISKQKAPAFKPAVLYFLMNYYSAIS